MTNCPACNRPLPPKNVGRFAKGKGESLETECCKRFGVWWGRGRFIRTKVMQCTGTSNRMAHGDIACVVGESPIRLDEEFPFSVECKNDEGWRFEHLFDLQKRKNSPIELFWKQCIEDAERWQKIPLLAIKKNFVPIVVVLRFADLEQWNRSIDPLLRPRHGEYLHPLFRCYVPYKGEKQKIVATTLDEFFRYFTPKHRVV